MKSYIFFFPFNFTCSKFPLAGLSIKKKFSAILHTDPYSPVVKLQEPVKVVKYDTFQSYCKTEIKWSWQVVNLLYETASNVVFFCIFCLSMHNYYNSTTFVMSNIAAVVRRGSPFWITNATCLCVHAIGILNYGIVVNPRTLFIRMKLKHGTEYVTENCHIVDFEFTIWQN